MRNVKEIADFNWEMGKWGNGEMGKSAGNGGCLSRLERRGSHPKLRAINRIVKSFVSTASIN